MFQSLRTRLLASYIAVLLVLILLIGLVLVVFLSSRPLPVESLINNLAATVLDIGSRSVTRITVVTPRSYVLTEIATFLDDEAELYGRRLLVVSADGLVLYDSAGAYDLNTPLESVEREALLATSPTASQRRSLLEQGRFTGDDGEEWLYVSQPLLLRMTGPSLMVAAPVPHPSLRQVFRQFGQTFFRPLAQAALVALLVAIALAALIARSVARPLQQISETARRIAGGDYRQRAPVTGPREVRSLATSFNDMAARVAAAQQAQRDFLANVSHDLRTPLTSIQGFSQAIAEGVAADADSARRAAQIINDETARLHRMVESLLDLARLEAGRVTMPRNPVRVGDVLRAVVESLSVKAEDAGVQLIQAIRPDLPAVLGDGDRLAQVFTNLADNAIRYTPRGGTVTISAHAADDGVRVTVRDTGEGIPPQDLPRIFERFYQVDKSRQRSPRGGIGLGLAIAREIVEAHGGTIQPASTPGEGTTITVWLPTPK